MSAAPMEPAAWYSVPEVAELLGLRQRDVRAMIKERRLLAVPHGPNAAASIPAEMLVRPGEGDRPAVLGSLQGTLTLLADSGYDDVESLRWLYAPNDELGTTPIHALREGHTHAVRRAALSLAF
ncbi:Rv2175c family DNA-binding protein [Georgenia ruanii]|nr:Rv2175c family DNA-binding protein [Georgenia ruanii]